MKYFIKNDNNNNNNNNNNFFNERLILRFPIPVPKLLFALYCKGGLVKC